MLELAVDFSPRSRSVQPHPVTKPEMLEERRRRSWIAIAVLLSACGGEVEGGIAEGADVDTPDGRAVVGGLYGSSARHDLAMVGTWTMSQLAGTGTRSRFEMTLEADGTLVTRTRDSHMVYDDQHGDRCVEDEPELLGTGCVLADRWRTIGQSGLGLLVRCGKGRLAEAAISIPEGAVARSAVGDEFDVTLVTVGARYTALRMTLERGDDSRPRSNGSDPYDTDPCN